MGLGFGLRFASALFTPNGRLIYDYSLTMWYLLLTVLARSKKKPPLSGVEGGGGRGGVVDLQHQILTFLLTSLSSPKTFLLNFYLFIYFCQVKFIFCLECTVLTSFVGTYLQCVC